VSSKHLATRLLSRRNRLTRGEKDEIFARVLAETAPRRRVRWPSLAFALVAATAAFVVVPRLLGAPGPGERRAEAPGFTARGDGATAFGLVCSGQASATCPLGQTLMFDLQGAPHRYFAAFARRDDGAVIWYFPDAATGRSLDLSERLSHGLLDQGIELDAAHGAGHYRVYAIYSAAPLSRDDIKSRFQPGARDLGVETAIATRELVVQ